MHRTIAPVLALLFLLLVGPVSAQTSRLDRCAEMVRDHPEEMKSYACYRAAASAGEADAAIRALEALLAIDPENPRPHYYLAQIERDRSGERAAELFRRAAEGFAARGDSRQEGASWLFHSDQLRKRGRFTEAEEGLGNSILAASAAGDPILEGWARYNLSIILRRNGDYGASLRELTKAEELVFPEGPAVLQCDIPRYIGVNYEHLGEDRKAVQAYERSLEIARRNKIRNKEVDLRMRIVVVTAKIEGRAGRFDRQAAIRELEEIIEIAVEIGDRVIESQARRNLGHLLWNDRGLGEVRRAMEISSEIGRPLVARPGLMLLSEMLADLHPDRLEEALGLADEAIELWRSVGDPEYIVLSLRNKALLYVHHDRWDDGITVFMEALDAIEKIRNLQPDGEIRARSFDRWVGEYYLVSHRILERGGDPEPAFRILERVRSRVLLDMLDATGAHPRVDENNADHIRRKEVVAEIAEVQRRLADHRLEENRRSALLDDLNRLELEESILRDAIARADPIYALVRAPEIPSIDEIGRILEPDQAVLTFQISTTPGDLGQFSLSESWSVHSWAILITQQGAEAFRLPRQAELEERLEVFNGLCRRRDGSEARVAARLYRDLLAEPLASLDPGIRSLVIVPDGCLHHLPFAALRPERDGEQLGVTFEIIQVPSVTLWSRWKSEGLEEQASPVLALADPELTGSDEDGTVRAADPWLEGLQLGPLPYARSEARKVLRNLGGGTLLSGAEANERYLKQAGLEEFGIVHFAAHAVVDYDRPDRSAVLLSPGADEEDGFLQPREIVDLDLDGKVVILSSCRSASGTVQRGEGVLGLARAFFQAGAHAVIGNLWVMRDEDAERFMAELSEHLGRGASLSAAFHAARAARVEAGAPVDAWAGLVLIGNGDMVPLPGGRSSGGAVMIILPLAVIGLAVLVYWRFRR